MANYLFTFESPEGIMTEEQFMNLFWKLNPKPKTAIELKVALNDYGTFLQF